LSPCGSDDIQKERRRYHQPEQQIQHSAQKGDAQPAAQQTKQVVQQADPHSERDGACKRGGLR